eukprot:CAMPEP_0180146456 /NCGR_PEP_ID=MMETSP0986-20121125/18503_1 /TAXON_ID=697907 /ORGANISM="non described non described, Strain CCMP2293" /LENGTH=78 /DNA_ID=CAMNT_0022091481 /DNA_START=142 /DNA_END=378 /DNA_ORIENTATION=+
MSGDGLRSSEMPTTVALVLCGASFFFGYRFKGWVDYQTGQVEKFRQHVKSQARTYTFRAVELVTVAGIVFLTFRRLRN